MANIQNKKDFFISYTGKDVSWATWIARTLENAGYTTIIQAWDFNIGDNFVDKMDAALKNSERFLAVLSEKYLNSPYCKAEWVAAFAKDINLEKAAFIPVRIENVIPSGIFAEVVYIDLFSLNEDTASKRLIDGVAIGGAIRPGQAGTKRIRFPGDMPLNNLPHSRNPYFTGRDKEIESTHAKFQNGDRGSLTQSVTGLGGVGKTTIVLEYAYRYSHEYETIWWVNAESSSNVVISYRDFALQKRIITEDAKADEIIEAMKHWFSNNENWLFIYDNADADDFSKWLESYMPQSSKGHVLVTTRSRVFPKSKSIDIIVFNEMEAVIFLKDRTQKIGEGYSDDLAKILTERLQYLPLALEQAAAYVIETPNVTYQNYIDMLTERGVESFKQENYLVDYTSIINLTWNISMQKITNEGARQMFNMCAYFAPDKIPVDMFVRGNEVLPEPLQAGVADLLQRNEILRDLTRYSLLKDGRIDSISADEKRTLDMHRLLQEVVQRNFGDDTTWLGYSLDLIHKVIDWKAGEKDSVNLFKIESPHAIAITEKALKVYKKDKKRLDSIAGVLNSIGDIDNDLGEYQKALNNHNKAMELWCGIYGKKHPNAATIYNSIGRVYYNLSEYAKALDYYNKAIKIYKRAFGNEHYLIGITYSNIGKAYIKLGKILGVSVLYDALKIFQKNYGENHPYTAMAYMDIGINHIENDSYKTLHSLESELYELAGEGNTDKGAEYALPSFEKALVIYRNIYGDSHYCTAISYNYIGKACIHLKQYDKSLDSLKIALNTMIDIYGDDHLYTAIVYANFGLFHSHLQEYDTAFIYFEKVSEIQKKFFSEKNLAISSLYSNIGDVLLKFGKTDEALLYFIKDVEILRINYDNDIENKKFEKEFRKGAKEGERILHIKNRKLLIFNVVIIIFRSFPALIKLIKLAFGLIKMYFKLKKMTKNAEKNGGSFDGLGDSSYSAFSYTDKQSASNTMRKKIIDRYILIADLYFKKENYENALKYYTQALEMKRRVGEDGFFGDNIISFYRKISIIYLNLGDNDNALEYCNKALQFYNYLLDMKNEEKEERERRKRKRKEDVEDDNDENSVDLDLFNAEIAELYDTAGKLQYRLNNYEKSLEYYNKAIEIQEKLSDGDGSKENIYVRNYSLMATTYENRCKVYMDRNEYEGALKSYNEALKMYQKDNNDNKLKQIELFDKILKLQIKIYGEESSETASTYNNAGVVYSRSGNSEKALEYYNKALEIRKKLFGEEDASTAQSYNNISTIYFSLEEYEKALEYQNRALEIRLKVHGKNNLTTTSSYEEVGNIHDRLKNTEKALECYKNAIDIRKNIKDNNSQKALELHEKILKLQQIVYGEEHTEIASTYNKAGVVYSRLDNKEKALEYYNKAFEIRKKLLGEDASTAQYCNNVGSIYFKLGEHEKALEYQKKALEIRLKIYGENHLTTASSYEDVGADYRKLGNAEKALDYYNKALNIRKRICPEGDPSIKAICNSIKSITDKQNIKQGVLQ